MAIGNYEPPSEIKVTAVPTPTTPSGAVVKGIEADLEEDIKENVAREAKNRTYIEILKDSNVTVDEAQAIVDDLMTKGYYSEEVQITKKITATFRTRNHSDYLRYSTALQLLNPKFRQEEDELALRYCLVGSIARFNTTNFAHPGSKTPPDEAQKMFDARLDWVEAQPERLTALLSVKLRRFDEKVMVVMSEGVAENF